MKHYTIYINNIIQMVVVVVSVVVVVDSVVVVVLLVAVVDWPVVVVFCNEIKRNIISLIFHHHCIGVLLTSIHKKFQKI